jgi:hypothetical protein
MAKITSYLHIRDVTKEDKKQSMSSFAIRSYLSYIWEVDYKGLNRIVTPRSTTWLGI